MLPTDLVRVATLSDTSAIAGLLAAAHADSAVGRWLADDPDGVTHIDWDAIVTAALADLRSLVHIVPDAMRGIAGVAVWYDHYAPNAPTVGFGVGPVDTPSPHTTRLGLLQACIGSYHPDKMPHQHLGYLVVGAAVEQRRDVASTLLDYHHRFLDLADLPAFTLAGDQDTVDLLTEHRYRLTGPINPTGAPPLHLAWRPSKSRVTADDDE